MQTTIGGESSFLLRRENSPRAIHDFIQLRRWPTQGSHVKRVIARTKARGMQIVELRMPTWLRQNGSKVDSIDGSRGCSNEQSAVIRNDDRSEGTPLPAGFEQKIECSRSHFRAALTTIGD
jgi:hypothetical protein